MTDTGALLANAAAELVGTPFRMGGRDPSTGLDCVGLIVASLEAIGRKVAPLPHYTIRQTEIGRLLDRASACGLAPCADDPRIGDVILLKLSPTQRHLAICGNGPRTIIHAHVGLRRITTSWLPLHWPIERTWRLD